MIVHTGSLHSLIFPSVVWRMPSKKIFLTFDDGPHTQATPSVLDVLHEHHIKGTFFLTGKNIPGRESIIKRIDNEGHSIGIHSYSHKRTTAFSKEKTLKEINDTTRLLSPLVKQKIRLYRPPYGFFTWNTLSAVKETGYILVMWSCLPGDYSGKSNDAIVKTSLEKLSGGSILVFHDNHRTVNKIAEVVGRTIVEIKSLGYEFGAIR